MIKYNLDNLNKRHCLFSHVKRIGSKDKLTFFKISNPSKETGRHNILALKFDYRAFRVLTAFGKNNEKVLLSVVDAKDRMLKNFPNDEHIAVNKLMCEEEDYEPIK